MTNEEFTLKLDKVLTKQVLESVARVCKGSSVEDITKNVNKIREKKGLRTYKIGNIRRYLNKLCELEYVCKEKSGKEHMFKLNVKVSDAVDKFKYHFPKDELKGLYVKRMDDSEKSLAQRIIDELEETNRDVYVIMGEPASGKTTLLRHIGHMLSSSKANVVYYIGPEYDEPSHKDVKELRSPLTWLLIDEADRIDRKKLNGYLTIKNLKIIVAMLDIKKQVTGTSWQAIIDELNEAREIKGSEVAEGIITSFLGKEKRSKLSDEIESQLAKNNLIQLSWQLEAYKEDGRVDKDAVSERVSEYIQNKLETELEVEGAGDVLLILSMFSQSEIPIEKQFVESLSSKDAVKKLVRLREIKVVRGKDGKYLELPHSKTAKIFFEAFNRIPDLGVNVKRIAEKTGMNWYEGLYSLYIKYYPNKICNFLFVLIYDCDGSTKKTRLILNLIKNHTYDLKTAMEKEEDLRILPLVLSFIFYHYDDYKHFFESIDIDTLFDYSDRQNIREFEIGVTILMIHFIAQKNKNIIKNIVEKVDLDLLKKIEHYLTIKFEQYLDGKFSDAASVFNSLSKREVENFRHIAHGRIMKEEIQGDSSQKKISDLIS